VIISEKKLRSWPSCSVFSRENSRKNAEKRLIGFKTLQKNRTIMLGR